MPWISQESQEIILKNCKKKNRKNDAFNRKKNIKKS